MNFKMKTTSLSAKLKEHLKRKVTPRKEGTQVHSVATTPEMDKIACLQKNYNKIREERDVMRK